MSSRAGDGKPASARRINRVAARHIGKAVRMSWIRDDGCPDETVEGRLLAIRWLGDGEMQIAWAEDDQGDQFVWGVFSEFEITEVG